MDGLGRNGAADVDWRSLIEPATTAFFLDVDGTLLGFKDRPEDVVADRDLLDLLACILDRSGGSVALVSGRTVADLDRIMSPAVFAAGGVHGADLRYADGRRDVFEGAALADIRKAAERFVAVHDGLGFEDKGGTTFALHYRRAPHMAEEVAAFVETLVVGHDLMVQHGKMVAEIKPKGCHKGLAIEALMRTAPFQGRRPLFIGDDLTDEYGFAAVNAQNGVSIKVGDDAHDTIALHRLADIFAVRDLLWRVCRSGEAA